jgi:2-keto-4-pentenoate hydratase/2-oxohepta-3-ene-1,7-dioic acid hydratase in catechol pathway
MKIICIGRNYADHVTEMGSERPQHPVFFLKADSCILKRNRPLYIPDFTKNLHYEAEIVLQICKLGKHIPVEFAHRYYNAFTLGIDFTARDLQETCKKQGLPWEISKSFDGSACLAPFIQCDSNKPLESIQFSLQKNGTTVQQSETGNMLFTFEEIISYISRFMTLKMGDIIYTGTPQGVGSVQPNDRLEGFIGTEKVLDMRIK